MSVATPRAEYEARAAQWQRCRDCYEGSDAVKARGDEYLPMLDSHATNPARYDAYRQRALFFNAVGRTVDGLSGAIHQKPAVLDLPARVADHAQDVTLAGVSAEMFALEATRELLKTGRYGVLVDMAAEAGAERPYWAAYHAEDIPNWRTTRVGGDEILTLVVLREEAEEVDPKDPFVLACETRYRVLEIVDGKYQQVVWREKEKDSDEWFPEEPIIPLRRGKPLDFIPFVFLGPMSVSAEVAKPPLLDLVDVNLSHYRTSADIEHARHWTALPTPWVAGSVTDDKGGPLAIGSSTAWMLTAGSQVGMLEFKGDGLGSLERALEEKRRAMAVLGAKLLEEQQGGAGAETATAVGMRHSGEHATLRTIAGSVAQGLTLVWQWHAWWMGTEAKPDETGAAVELNKEFFTVRCSPEEAKVLLLKWQAGAISYATFYAGLQRGAWARDGVTAEQEREEIDREGEERPEPEPPAGDPPPDDDEGDEE